jgi:5-deoxy-D-glucuronate isomerase
MSYKNTLQEHNILLQQAIDKANALPDAGSGGKPEQEKIVAEDITTNGAHTFYPDDGYTMSKVTVNVNVPDTPAVVEELNVIENGEYTPGDGVDGFSKVTVNVSAGTTETWTFTMEDGSEVTKDVVVA